MSKKNIQHIYTTIKVEQATARYRYLNFTLLITMMFLQRFNFYIFSDLSVYLVIGSVLGLDLTKIIPLKKGYHDKRDRRFALAR